MTREDFEEALNAYISDSYSDKTLDIIQKFNTEPGIDFDPKFNKPLYRGIFIAEPTKQQLEVREHTTFSSWFWEDSTVTSWTTSLEDAIIFAKGSNIYEKEVEEFPKGSLGLVITPQRDWEVLEGNNLIIDLDFALEQGLNIDIIEENEVLLRPIMSLIYKKFT